MTMARQNSYYSSTSVRSNNHGTSSAFSSSANPDEDWTKISDLAERRRIQNRIAQRNYRKKLKRRLEDLERRAGSSSESPPQQHSEIKQTESFAPIDDAAASTNAEAHRRMSPLMVHNQYTPPMQSDDEILFANNFDRDGSRTPPLFGYHTYPAPEDIVYPAYPHQYRPVTLADRADNFADYMAPIPVSLPSMMHFGDAMKRDAAAEGTLSPYTSYAMMAGIDIPSSHPYDAADPHTPPLSHSYEHSTTCSEAGWPYPSTPMSIPASPRALHNL